MTVNTTLCPRAPKNNGKIASYFYFKHTNVAKYLKTRRVYVIMNYITIVYRSNGNVMNINRVGVFTMKLDKLLT